MTASTHIIIQDPVDSRALFDAAREVAEDDGPYSAEDRGTGTGMFIGLGGAGTTATVHFSIDGGLYPPSGKLPGWPDCYALVIFKTQTDGGPGTEALPRHQAALTRTLGRWLDERSVRWTPLTWTPGDLPGSGPPCVGGRRDPGDSPQQRP